MNYNDLTGTLFAMFLATRNKRILNILLTGIFLSVLNLHKGILNILPTGIFFLSVLNPLSILYRIIDIGKNVLESTGTETGEYLNKFINEYGHFLTKIVIAYLSSMIIDDILDKLLQIQSLKNIFKTKN